MSAFQSQGMDPAALTLAACFDIFAIPVWYQPAEGGVVPLRGIYDDRSAVEKTGDGGVPTIEYKPVLGVRLADLPPGFDTPHQNELFKINGQLYRVVDAQEDGHGHAKLVLGLATA